MGSRLVDKAKRESGYSLVEVLAAIVILTVAILPMVGMFDAGLRATSTSGNYDRARTLANTNLEAAKTVSFSEVADRDSCWEDGDSDLECDVETEYVYLEIPSGADTGEFAESEEGDPRDMLKVTVTVQFGPNDKEYSTSGIVAE
jgi:prepilin-type N-terminal cleavage/methylation domain-containing protein